MTRRFEKWVTKNGQALLSDLVKATNDPPRYRELMQGLGVELAGQILAGLEPKSRVAVVCTAEDADFLARGFLEEAQREEEKVASVAFVCFWNDRQTLGDRVKVEIAPIFRRYVEPMERSLDALIVLKSIMSDGCTIKTNIQEVIAHSEPKRVIVGTPVILKGAPDRVREEFPAAIARRFEFVFLAEDDQKNAAGWVDPGVGGEVYRLLGLGDKSQASRYRPTILKERRARLGR